MGFRIKDIGESYKLICEGSKSIGRICKHADGSYLGLIGKYITVRGCKTEKEALNEAVAQHLRYNMFAEKKKNGKKKKATMHHKPIVVPPSPPTMPTERFTATRAFMRQF